MVRPSPPAAGRVPWYRRAVVLTGSCRGLVPAALVMAVAAPASGDSGLAPGLYGSTLDGRIVAVDPDSGATSPALTLDLAAASVMQVLDIAFDAAGDLFVLDGPGRTIRVYEASTGTLPVVTATCTQLNALGVDRLGRFVAAGGANFYVQERDGTCSASVPLSNVSAGDAAEGPSGRLFVATSDPLGGDVLEEVDLPALSSGPVGSLGHDCGLLAAPAWEGLALLADGRLVGSTRDSAFGCQRVCVVDPDTAATSDCRALGAPLSGLGVRPASDECPPPMAPGPPAVTDLDPCRPGLLVEWDEATWPDGLPGVYNVYRLRPDCTAPAELVVTALSVTSWLDSEAVAGVPNAYVIEAEADATCGDGPAHAGPTDATACSAAVVDAFDLDPPPDRVGGTLLVTREDPSGAAVLTWTASGQLPDEELRVLRAELPDRVFAEIPPAPAAPPFTDSAPLPPSRRWNYRVATVDSCGNGSR